MGERLRLWPHGLRWLSSPEGSWRRPNAEDAQAKMLGWNSEKAVRLELCCEGQSSPQDGPACCSELDKDLPHVLKEKGGELNLCLLCISVTAF